MMTAWVCTIIILVSGILSTQRAGALNTEDLFHTTYGKLIVVKTVIIISWLVTAFIITATAMGINKMMETEGPPPMDKIKASVGRIKMLSKTNNVTGLAAMVAAVALRFYVG